VTEIVCKADGLGQRFVEPQGQRHRARDLRYFDGVCDPCAIQVTLMIHEYLCFVDEPAKRVRMDDAIAIALKFAAKSGFGFRVATTARLFVVRAIGR
jgi:hypothetical protein